MNQSPPCPLCGRPKLARNLFGVAEEWAGWACRDCQNEGDLCFQCGEQAADDSALCPTHRAQQNEEAALRGDLDDE